MGFAVRLRELRRYLKLTQNEFSEKICITQATLCGYEKKKRVPDGEILSNIANVYNVNINWLLTGEGAMFLSDVPPLSVGNVDGKDAVSTGVAGGDKDSVIEQQAKEIEQLKKEIALYNKANASLESENLALAKVISLLEEMKSFVRGKKG